MKEAVGGGWLFTIVIIMVVLFASFISISTNYSRSYKVKDEIISSVQRNHGVNVNSLTQINSYLNEVGYRSTGVCPKDGEAWLGFSYTDNEHDVSNSHGANYCIKKHTITYRYKNSAGQCVSNGAVGHPESAYYSVMTFFKLDMPVIRELFHLRVEGETSIIYMIDDLPKFYTIEGRERCDT